MSIHTIDFRVKGKVQGVSFRVFTRDLAQQHGLVGWVKNEPVSVPARAQPYDFMIVLIATLAMTDAEWRRYRNSPRTSRGSGKIVSTAQLTSTRNAECGLKRSCSKEGIQQGPPRAKVTSVEFTNEAPLERLQFQGFEKVRNPRPS